MQKTERVFFLAFLRYCEERGEKRQDGVRGFALNFDSNVRLVYISAAAVKHFSETCRYLFFMFKKLFCLLVLHLRFLS